MRAARPATLELYRRTGEPMLPRGLVVSTVTVPAAAIHDAALHLAEERGWLRRGWSWVCGLLDEVRYTTDGWRTSHVLRAGDHPTRLTADGRALLTEVEPGTEVEFAARIRVVALRPGRLEHPEARGEAWLNRPGENFHQRST